MKQLILLLKSALKNKENFKDLVMQRHRDHHALRKVAHRGVKNGRMGQASVPSTSSRKQKIGSINRRPAKSIGFKQ